MDFEASLQIRQQIAALRVWTFGLFMVWLSASATAVIIYLALPHILVLPHMQNPDNTWRLGFIFQGLIYLLVVSFFALLVCRAKITRLKAELISSEPNEIALHELEESRRTQVKALDDLTRKFK